MSSQKINRDNVWVITEYTSIVGPWPSRVEYEGVPLNIVDHPNSGDIMDFAIDEIERDHEEAMSEPYYWMDDEERQELEENIQEILDEEILKEILDQGQKESK